MNFFIVFWGLCGNEHATQLLFVSFLFMPWKRRRKLFLLRFLISVAAYVVIGRFVPVPQPWIYLLMFVLIVGMVMLCFKVSIIPALFHSTNIYCIQYILSSAAYSIFFALIVSGQISGQISAMSNSIAVLNAVMMAAFCITIVATFFIYTLRNFNFAAPQFNNPYIVIAMTVFISVAVFLSHYGQSSTWYGQDPTSDDFNFAAILAPQIYIKLIALLCAGLTILVNYMNCRNKKLQIENSVLQLLLAKDKEQYEKARISAEQINIKFHDLKHKENKGILEKEDIDEIGRIAGRYFTGNKAVDIVLGEKAIKCENERIRLISTADGSAIDFMKAHQIYSLLGNAIDNAIESLRDIKDDTKREIVASITKRGNMCLVRVSNYFDKEIVFSDSLPKTTKSDSENHGYGTKSMKNIVESYGGEIYFSAKNNIFTLMIMLPLPSKNENK